MTTDITKKTELLESLEETSSQLISLIKSFDINEINKIPFADSWTAAQVADHITKSNKSIAKALQLPGVAADRAGDERVEELKNVFLDFSTKLKSPEFILPGKEKFEKEVLIVNLAHSINTIKAIAKTTDVFTIINHPIFGTITKYEILYFVLYHTQRHIHQLKKIATTFNK